MPSQSSRLFLGATLALATSIVMSLATAATKYVAGYVAIEQIVAVQYCVCVTVMLPLLKKEGWALIQTSHPWLHLVRGMAGWLCFYTYYLALDKIPLVDAALLRNTAPICVPVILFFWKGFRMPFLNWMPVIIGFLGILLVLNPQGSGFSLWHLVGLGSAVTLAGSIVTTRALTLTEPTSRILFYYFSFSALCSIPMAIKNWQTIPLGIIPFLLGIGVSILLIMWLYTSAYSYAKASVISPISYTGVLFTGLLGWFIWDQIPDFFAIAGAILIISGGLGSVFLGRERN